MQLDHLYSYLFTSQYVLSHYHLSVCILSALLTYLLGWLIKSYQSTARLFYQLVCVLPVYVLLTLFLMGEYLPSNQYVSQEILGGWVLIQVLLGIVVFMRCTRIQSNKIDLSSFQTCFQEALILVSSMVVLCLVYLEKTLLQNRYNNTHTSISLESVTSYLAVLLMVVSSGYTLYSIENKYAYKLEQLWFDLKVDWRKDTYNLTKLENDLQIVSTQTRYLQEKYIMTANKMDKGLQAKYRDLVNEQSRLQHRYKQAKSISGTGVRLKKDLVLVAGLIKTLFQLQVFIMWMLMMWVGMANKMGAHAFGYSPLTILNQINHPHVYFIAKILILFLYLQAHSDDSESIYVSGIKKSYLEMIKSLGAVGLMFFILPQSLFVNHSSCMDRTWFQQTCQKEQTNLFGQILFPFIQLNPEFNSILFIMVATFSLLFPIRFIIKQYK